MYLKLDENKWYRHTQEWSDRLEGIGKIEVYKGQIEVVENVVPVAHAHWETDNYGYAILNEDGDMLYLAGVPCSRCHVTGHTNWNYCPDCGAKMDEEAQV